MFDSYLFVMRGREITIYFNGVRGETHPQGPFDIRATRTSTIHVGQVHDEVDLPERLEDIPETAWMQKIEQIDLLEPHKAEDHHKVLHYPQGRALN